uniref:Alpha-tubulin n-acetyltransferase-like protein n=1 Tax=Triatoma infestans TaxID=30076 RepID=A0A161MKE9_TRIIF
MLFLKGFFPENLFIQGIQLVRDLGILEEVRRLFQNHHTVSEKWVL